LYAEQLQAKPKFLSTHRREESLASIYREQHQILSDIQTAILHMLIIYLKNILPGRKDYEIMATTLLIEGLHIPILISDAIYLLNDIWDIYYPLGEPLTKEEIKEIRNEFMEWVTAHFQEANIIEFIQFKEWFELLILKISKLYTFLRKQNYAKVFKYENYSTFMKLRNEERQKTSHLQHEMLEKQLGHEEKGGKHEEKVVVEPPQSILKNGKDKEKARSISPNANAASRAPPASTAVSAAAHSSAATKTTPPLPPGRSVSPAGQVKATSQSDSSSTTSNPLTAALQKRMDENLQASQSASDSQSSSSQSKPSRGSSDSKNARRVRRSSHYNMTTGGRETVLLSPPGVASYPAASSSAAGSIKGSGGSVSAYSGHSGSQNPYNSSINGLDRTMLTLAAAANSTTLDYLSHNLPSRSNASVTTHSIYDESKENSTTESDEYLIAIHSAINQRILSASMSEYEVNSTTSGHSNQPHLNSLSVLGSAVQHNRSYSIGGASSSVIGSNSAPGGDASSSAGDSLAPSVYQQPVSTLPLPAREEESKLIERHLSIYLGNTSNGATSPSRL
jgi:hypothetical protein